jgi:hypothetical protein
MSRDGFGIYSKPAGTTAVSGTTIDSAKYNATIDDLVSDANAARPITAGGTGATDAATARTNIGAVDATIINALNAANLTTGTIPDGRMPAPLNALSPDVKALLDDLNAAGMRGTLGVQTQAENDARYLRSGAQQIPIFGPFIYGKADPTGDVHLWLQDNAGFERAVFYHDIAANATEFGNWLTGNRLNHGSDGIWRIGGQRVLTEGGAAPAFESVGSYAFLARNSNAAPIYAGTHYPGSDLVWAAVISASNYNYNTAIDGRGASGAVAGTWMALGTSAGTETTKGTLFVRVA